MHALNFEASKGHPEKQENWKAIKATLPLGKSKGKSESERVGGGALKATGCLNETQPFVLIVIPVILPNVNHDDDDDDKGSR